MFKRMIPLAVVAALGVSLTGCYENEPIPEGGGGGVTQPGVVDLDNDGVIEQGEPGFVDRDGDGIHDTMVVPDVGEPETPNEPMSPAGE